MKNLNTHIPEKVYINLYNIAKKFNENGYECYLVGGSVRDLILNNDVYDYDFATNAKPEQVMELFNKTAPTGIKHGTVSVIMDQNSYEITTFRADGKYIDGRRPETVSFSKTLEEDVKRRDFTINGLAYDLLQDKILDYVNGIEDINRKIIKTIGDPIKRFNEDGLRPFRACRFAAKLNFDIEENTFDSIKNCLGVAKLVSIERVRDELMKILETEKPSTGIEYLRESGLLNLFLPELAECFGVSQNKYHVFDIYYHSIYSCDSAPKNMPLIRLAALLHDIGKVSSRRIGDDGDYTFYNHEVIGTKIVKKIMRRLKFSNEQIEKVSNLVVNHMFHYTDEWTDGAVRRFMRKVELENLDDLFLLRLADRKGNGARKGLPAPIQRLKERIEKAIEEENAITVKDLDINGTIIMDKFNLKPGPVIGKILNTLLEMVLDDPEVNKRDILLDRAKEILDSLK